MNYLLLSLVTFSTLNLHAATVCSGVGVTPGLCHATEVTLTIGEAGVQNFQLDLSYRMRSLNGRQCGWPPSSIRVLGFLSPKAEQRFDLISEHQGRGRVVGQLERTGGARAQVKLNGATIELECD